MRATDFKALERNTLRGFFTLHLDSGLVIHDCSYHERDDKQWVGLPSKPQLDREGRHRVDDKGKKLYLPVLDFKDKATREKFQLGAVRAVLVLVGRAAA